MTNPQEHARLLRSLLKALDAVSTTQPESPRKEVGRLRELIHAGLFRLESRTSETPLIAALFGPSGSGKSSLFNAALGTSFSHTSSIERPATRGAICALPRDCDENLRTQLLPTLKHIGEETHSQGHFDSLTVIPQGSLPGLVLIDCPDYDTHFEMNRDAARKVFAWADLIILMVSVERYADRSTAEEFEHLGAEARPVLGILNRVPGEAEDLLNAWARELERTGLKVIRMIPIAEGPDGMGGADEAVSFIRNLAATQSRLKDADWSSIYQSLEREILPWVRHWRRRSDVLLKDLASVSTAPQELQFNQAVLALESWEEKNKFWLRYSPRGVMRGLGTLLLKPGSLFRSHTPPRSLGDSQLGQFVMDQAWDVLHDYQIRSREVLQQHDLGKLLLEDQNAVADIEFTREDCRKHFEPLADDLRNFGRERLERARREWSDHSRGPMVRARIWALDKVLQLLTLGLTLAVLPPLVWELLRFVGHPQFTNEVTREFDLLRQRFTGEIQVLVERQRAAWARQLDQLGVSQDGAEELKRLAGKMPCDTGDNS